MLTLYHCYSARSFRPLWTLEEAGVPYTLEMLRFPPRVFDRSYLAINPLGTIPLLIDGDTRMTESTACSQYIASKHSPRALNVEIDEPDYGAYLNYLSYGEATLTFPQTLVLRYRHFEPEQRRQPQVADDYAKWFLARLRGAEARLADREFLAAGRFTAADISVGYALLLAESIGLAPQFPKAVAAYYDRLRNRAGYLRAFAAQDAACKAKGIPTDIGLGG